MTRLTWGGVGERVYETGVDRAVLYTRSPQVLSSGSQTVSTGTKTFLLDVPSIAPPFLVGTRVVANADQGGTMKGVVTNTGPSFLMVDVDEVSAAFDNDGWTITRADLAVSWNGLTGVEESGGDSATTFYVDGRPYFVFNRPKEFAATLKAFTYPDAFSEIMGIVEAVPGMYVDSQNGNIFDLCYRTKIGNDVSSKLGYKIHLIYNAFVTPSAPSYETIGSDVSPNEFSWEIAAVPTPLEGYRAAAHITIDSRNIDSSMLTSLENMLYGTSTSDPSFPTPQYVHDLLTYGSSVIIIDHGDGTWEAQGSSDNVRMIDEDTFEIDGAIVDEGFGGYTISSSE